MQPRQNLKTLLFPYLFLFATARYWHISRCAMPSGVQKVTLPDKETDCRTRPMLDTYGVQAVCKLRVAPFALQISDLTRAICPTGSTLPVYRPPYKFWLHTSRRVAGGASVCTPPNAEHSAFI